MIDDNPITFPPPTPEESNWKGILLTLVIIVLIASAIAS